jgi:hypothetical protein
MPMNESRIRAFLAILVFVLLLLRIGGYAWHQHVHSRETSSGLVLIALTQGIRGRERDIRG